MSQETEVREQLFCWRDGGRPCGADCVAYVTHGATPIERCAQLSCEVQQLKHLTVISNAAARVHNYIDDSVRTRSRVP